jgi:serine/threonine protein phosphatase PrpC
MHIRLPFISSFIKDGRGGEGAEAAERAAFVAIQRLWYKCSASVHPTETPMAIPADNTAAQCPVCGTSDIAREADVCAQCGAAIGSAGVRSARPEPLRPGAVIGDRYLVESIQWTWSDRTVYNGRVEGGSERVLISERSASDEDPLDEAGFARPGETSTLDTNPFRTEHAILSKFDYSGILRPQATFIENDRAYLVYDWTDGEPLSAVVPVAEGEARAWGLQLCQIVSLIHRQGIVHNGVEPSSFIVDGQRRVRLVRFDRCRPTGAFRSDAPTPYVPSFSAPELQRVDADSLVDPKSDVYSIGALLHFLLAGEPLPARDAAMLQTRELELYPRLIIAPGFERIVGRALAPHPEDRYRSVNEMKLALADLNVTVNVRAGHFTDVGKVRELNEDSLLVLNLTQYFESVQTNIGLYIVSDGMGGEAAGEVASRVTVRAIAEWITDKLISASLKSTHGERIAAETETGGIRLASSTGADVRASELLTNAIIHANQEVLQYARLNPHTRGLGATVTAAMLVGNSLTVGHVGDSRAYVVTSKGIEQITEDHSIVERMVREGQIERDEARFHPYRNVIYRSIGCREEIEIDIVRCMLRSGESFVLCSDGLNGMLTDSEIHDVVGRNPEPTQAAKELVVAANAQGGEDNISVVVVTVL